MSHRIAASLLAAGLLSAGLLSAGSAFAAPRTYVASYGNDANAATNCGPTAPCRTFAAAMPVVDAGGEVIVLDSAGYGSVTIDKSLSIIAPDGIYAGLTAASGNVVTIATAGVKVNLKGLSINSSGAPYGVNMTNGASLTIENCTFSNFGSSAYSTNFAVYVATAADVSVLHSVFKSNSFALVALSGAKAMVSDSRFVGNNVAAIASSDTSATTTLTVERSLAQGGSGGFMAESSASGAITRLYVTDSVATGQSDGGMGVYAVSGASSRGSVSGSLITASMGTGGLYAIGTGAKLVIGGSTVTDNTVGLTPYSGGIIESAGDNVVRNNTTQIGGSGTITTFSPM